MEEFNNKPLWQLTTDEFIEILNKSRTPNETNINNELKIDKYAYGIKGLAELLGKSKRYAQKLKSLGIFDEAITQRGRTIIVNKEKAIELFKKHSND